MSALETSAPADEAVSALDLAGGSWTIPYGQEDMGKPVFNTGGLTLPDQQEAATETSTPPEPDPETPSEEVSTPPSVNWTEVTEKLTDDEMRDLAASNPKFKRYMDGLVGGKVNERMERIRQEAADAAIADFVDQNTKFQEAWAKYEEIEELREDDPERYETYRTSRTHQQWVTNLLAWRDNLVAAAQPKPKGSNAPANVAELSDKWNRDGFELTRRVLTESADWYQHLPHASRQAIENAIDGPSGSVWIADMMKAFADGTKAHFDTQLKQAVAAAREAGRNEALAEQTAETPVRVTNPQVGGRSARQILSDHAFGRAPVSQEELRAANRELGIAS
jgi:hypothetical protein